MIERTKTSEVLFDIEGTFGDDYLYFYRADLTPERNDREADVIWRLLALQKQAIVLDLGCGHGRMSVELAKRGAVVTGLDSSKRFLRLARQATTAAGLHVDYIEGDMRALPWSGKFDAVFIWFTTFGYFDDHDNEQVIRQVWKALKPGGRLLIEQIHRNGLLRQGLPQNFVVQRNDDLMIDHVDYDALSERSKTERVVMRDGQVRRTQFSVRLYGFAELKHLLHAAGFQSVQGFGRDGEPLTTYNHRLITLATKSAGSPS